MTVNLSARFTLRAATSRDHETVDHAFADFDLGTRDGYAAFLAAQAGAYLPIEAAIDRMDLAQALPDWHLRRRSSLLIADLLDLGVTATDGNAVASYDNIEAALGAIYVLEGSRLGGRVLARSVSAGMPRRFLDAGDPALWHRLVEVLDGTLRLPWQLDAAIEAARDVFMRFKLSAVVDRAAVASGRVR